jgi:hypothetical protein
VPLEVWGEKRVEGNGPNLLKNALLFFFLGAKHDSSEVYLKNGLIQNRFFKDDFSRENRIQNLFCPNFS